MNPEIAAAQHLLDAGHPDAALRRLRAVLAADPPPEALHVAARAHAALGQLPRGLAAWEAALRRHPKSAAHWLGLARTLAETGRLDEALATLDAARPVAIRDPDWAFQRALVLQRLGRTGQAMAAYKVVLKRDPTAVPAMRNLAVLRGQTGQPDAAAALRERAWRVRPDDATLGEEWAVSLHRAGRLDAARAAADAVLAEHPDAWGLRWRVQQMLPQVYPTTAALDAARARWDADLESLLGETHAALDRGDAAAAGLVGGIEPTFAAHYQGGPQRDRQVALGRLFDRLVRQAHPDLAAPPPAPPKRARLKVAFVSNFWRKHTVGRLFSGLATHLDPDRFEAHVWLHGAEPDDATRALADSPVAVAAPRVGWPTLARRLRAEEYDAVVFPEVGMHVGIAWLAACRLAPVQAAAWGHPVTPGLPSLTHFLTSGWMEPPEPQGHYAEELVVVPHAGVHWTPPPPAAPMRSRLGLDDDRPVLLCAQSLFKLLPRQDAAFAEVARRAPEARLVFVSDAAQATTQAFANRLAAAFAAQGLHLPDHVRLMPRLPHDLWLSLLASADVLLDSFGWSGGQSTLEGLSQGCPVVATWGETMRGRHSAGLLRGAGLPVAEDEAAWVEEAVRLARNAEARAEARRQTAERAPRIFEDPAPVRALEDWLTAVTGG